MNNDQCYRMPNFPPNMVTIKSERGKIPQLRKCPTRSVADLEATKALITISLKWNANNWPSTGYLRKEWRRFGFCWVNGERNQVYYRYPLGPLRFHLQINNLDSDSTSLFVNASYWRFPVRIGANWTARQHLRDIVEMKLVKEGYLTLHGASLCSSKGDAALIISPPDTGKSVTVLLGQKEGFRLITDDITLSDGVNLIPGMVDGQKIWSGAFLATKRGTKAKLQRTAIKIVQIAGLEAYDRVLIRLGGTQLSNTYSKAAPLKHIFFLTHGSNNTVTSMDRLDALRMLSYNQKAEFTWRSNPLVLGYEYHTLALSLPHLENREDELLETLVNRSDSCHIIQATHPKHFIELIKEIFPP